MATWGDVHRAEPRVRAGTVREVPARPGVGRRRTRASCSRAGRRPVTAKSSRARRPQQVARRSDAQPLRKAVGAVNLAQSIRRYGHLAAKLDPLGVRAAHRRSVAAAGMARRHRGRSAAAARDTLIRSPLAEGASNMAEVVDALRGASTVRAPATTTRTSSSPKSGAGSGTRRRPDSSARRTIRSIRSRCSTGCRRSRPSSASCTARSPARRGSRSKAPTCWCRSSTR